MISSLFQSCTHLISVLWSMLLWPGWCSELTSGRWLQGLTVKERERRKRKHYVPGGRSFCDLLSICWVLLSWPCVAWKAAALFKSDGVADSQHSLYKPPVTFVCCLCLSYIHTPTMHASCRLGFLACHLITFFPPHFSFFFSQVCL